MNRGVSRRLAPREKGKLWLSAPLLWDRGLRCRALSFPATQQQWVAAFRGAPGRAVRARASVAPTHKRRRTLLVSGFHDPSERLRGDGERSHENPVTLRSSWADPDWGRGSLAGVVARGQAVFSAATEAPGDRRLPWWYRSITTPRAAAGQPVPRSTAEEQLDGVKAGPAGGARPGQ